MNRNTKEKQMISDYEIELNDKKKYTPQEIENLIVQIDDNPYQTLRTLIESQLLFAYQIAITYESNIISTLEFINCADEGLEIAVTGRKYHNYDTFMQEVEKGIKDSLEILINMMKEAEN